MAKNGGEIGSHSCYKIRNIQGGKIHSNIFTALPPTDLAHETFNIRFWPHVHGVTQFGSY